MPTQKRSRRKKPERKTQTRYLGGMTKENTTIEIVFGDFMLSHKTTNKRISEADYTTADGIDYEAYTKYEDDELARQITNCKSLEEKLNTFINQSAGYQVSINKETGHPYKKMLNDHKDTLCIKKENFSKLMIYSTNIYMKTIMDPIYILFLRCTNTNKIIGFCQLQIHYYNETPEKVEVKMLCGSDHSGVGKHLISFTKEFAKFMGLPIYIEAYTTSVGFYKKMGFECEKTKKRKKSEIDITVCRMGI
jgi:hypothetical protein